MLEKRRRVTRVPEPCPKCGAPARAAYYRGEKRPGTTSGKFMPAPRWIYCKACDKYHPRTK